MSAGDAAGDLGLDFAAMPVGSVVTEVVERLMGAFTSGQIPPGTRLPSERTLATQLQVGRSAIREALAALEILGIVIVRPGSGTYLRGGASELLPRTLSWGLMLGERRTRELVELRSGLEVQAAELAAARITDEELERLAGFVAIMRANVADLDAFKEADSQFHRSIAAGSGNSVLEDLLQSISSLLRIWVDRGLRDQQHAVVAAREHEEIYDALRARDVELVRRVVTQHMQSASARLLSEFDAG